MALPNQPFNEAITRRFAQVLYRCLEEVGATKGALYILAPGEAEFHLVGHFGFPRQTPPPEALAPSHPLVAWIGRERRSFVLHDGTKYPELSEFTAGATSPRFLLTPIYHRGDWVGILIQRDRIRGEAFDLARDETPTASICEGVVEALREFSFILSPEPVTARPEPQAPGRAQAIPVPVPPSDSMIPPAVPRMVPSGTERIEGYGETPASEQPTSLVARSGTYAAHNPEPPAPEAPPPPLRVGMFMPEQRTFFWETATLLSALVPLSAVALWMDDPEEIRPILAHSRVPLAPELKQQILAHATFHIPKVQEKDLQILTRCEWPDEPPLMGVFQTYLPVVLMEEGGGQDLMLIFRVDEKPFDEEEQIHIQQVARLLGFHLQESRLHEHYHRSFLTVAHRILTSMEGGAPKLKSHSLNTARLARNFALSLELASPEVEAISISAILHDVGTFMLDPQVLGKPSLSAEDMASIQTHPVLASTFLKDFRFPFDVLKIIRHHHERWDGSGYPDGLQGEQIPIGSRVINLVEAFEVMSSGSEFHPAKGGREILDELKRGSGNQFDPNLVTEFLNFLAAKARQAPMR